MYKIVSVLIICLLTVALSILTSFRYRGSSRVAAGRFQRHVDQRHAERGSIS
jgi:hypothetical protein